MALHDCCQAVKFSEAAADLMTRVNLNSYRGDRSGAVKSPKFSPQQWYSAAIAQFLTAMATYGESETCIGLT